ncbi:MAG: PEP-CTERM sorting domain-containing protein, partial [Pseudomonadota bacterium]
AVHPIGTEGWRTWWGGPTRRQAQGRRQRPEPGTITLLGLGLAGFAVLRKRRSSFQAMRAQQKAVSDAKRGVEQLKAAA